MFELITNEPFFGVLLTFIAYQLGIIAKQRLGELVNPLLVAVITIIAVILILKIPYVFYNNGGNLITLMINPATVLLAVPLYKNIRLVKKYFIPIIIGSMAGILASLLSVTVLCKVFNISKELELSLIPKTITTAIAIPLSDKLNGMISLTVVAVILTGIIGSIASPFILSILRIKSTVSKGVAIGTSSHAIGTSKAIELGEEVGAISSIAMVLAGISMAIVLEFLIYYNWF